MELCEDGNLGKLISQNYNFSELQVKLLIAQLLLSIDFMDEHHVIHRDLKPENILIRFEN